MSQSEPPSTSINLNYVPDWSPFTSINLNYVPDWGPFTFINLTYVPNWGPSLLLIWIMSMIEAPSLPLIWIMSLVETPSLPLIWIISLIGTNSLPLIWIVTDWGLFTSINLNYVFTSSTYVFLKVQIFFPMSILLLLNHLKHHENVSDDFDLIFHGQTIILFENDLRHPFISINLNYAPDWGPFMSINLNCVSDAPSLPLF